MNDNVNPKLAEIRDMVISALHEGLQDEKKRRTASFLNSAVSVLKMYGGAEIKSPEEVQEGIAALHGMFTPRISANGTPVDAEKPPQEQPYHPPVPAFVFKSRLPVETFGGASLLDADDESDEF
jgi:hypothetical protein